MTTTIDGEVTAAVIDLMCATIDHQLGTFQWALPDRSANHGEVTVDYDTHELVLVVWCLDNDNDDNDELQPLTVRIPVVPDVPPRAQIRHIIHQFLCHDADEQMWFGNERPFYPHGTDPRGVTR